MNVTMSGILERSVESKWAVTRADGYVFSCDVSYQARDWMLVIACNGLVFGRRACESRQEAEAWARSFLAGLRRVDDAPLLTND